MSDDEQWRPIPGFDGAYELSDHGRVRSWKLWMGGPPPPRIMKIQTNAQGRRWIQLGLHGGRHMLARLMHEVWGIELPEGIRAKPRVVEFDLTKRAAAKQTATKRAAPKRDGLTIVQRRFLERCRRSDGVGWFVPAQARLVRRLVSLGKLRIESEWRYNGLRGALTRKVSLLET